MGCCELSVSLEKGFLGAAGTLAAGRHPFLFCHTSLFPFWCTLIGTRTSLSNHHYADKKARFPGELLSLAQNKDGPWSNVNQRDGGLDFK